MQFFSHYGLGAPGAAPEQDLVRSIHLKLVALGEPLADDAALWRRHVATLEGAFSQPGAARRYRGLPLRQKLEAALTRLRRVESPEYAASLRARSGWIRRVRVRRNGPDNRHALCAARLLR